MCCLRLGEAVKTGWVLLLINIQVDVSMRDLRVVIQ